MEIYSCKVLICETVYYLLKRHTINLRENTLKSQRDIAN